MLSFVDCQFNSYVYNLVAVRVFRDLAVFSVRIFKLYSHDLRYFKILVHFPHAANIFDTVDDICRYTQCSIWAKIALEPRKQSKLYLA